MVFRSLSVLLLASLAVGQATPNPSPKAPKAADSTARASNASEKGSEEIGPNTPVITIVGVCDTAGAPTKAGNSASSKSAAAKAKTGAACKTVITKSQFESLANALQPNMNPATKRMLADRYPKMLVFADAAHKRGLDSDPGFKKVLQFYKMQILTQELARSVKDQSEKIPDSELQKYYSDNTPEFEEASLQRLYIPKDKQVEPAAGEKPTTVSADQRKADEEALKKEAATLRSRAVAGEDFDKLQKEAYDAAGLKTTPPQTNISKQTRNELPVDHRSVLDLKAGEVSQVIAEPNGYYVYKVLTKDVKPFDAVKSEISLKLAQQKFQDEMKSIEDSAKAELNEAYFGTPPAPPSMPGMPPGAMRPGASGQRPAPPQVAPTPSQPTPANPAQNPESPKK